MSGLPHGLIWLAALAVAAVISAGFLKRPGAAASVGGIVRRQLLTDAEVRMLELLELAVPAHRVFAQVAMNALLRPEPGLKGAARTAVRNRFAQKVCDFVIADGRTAQVLAVVELDDASHRVDRDQQRDAMLTAGGYRTIRIPSKPMPTAVSVMAALAAIASPQDTA